jgi:ABC-2 type transport system ATP-binding protein
MGVCRDFLRQIRPAYVTDHGTLAGGDRPRAATQLASSFPRGRPARASDVTGEPRVLVGAEGVWREFGVRVALEPVDFAIRAGETVALVGPNGAGKSTLLAILAGALEPSGGHVSMTDPPPRIAWSPQRPAIYGRLSARENLELFARLERLPDARERAGVLLRQFELPDEKRPASRLSGGMVQRLNLAVALLAEPDVLVLDEPTAALDLDQRGRLWALARRTCARGGAVAFATHNLDEVKRVANRVVALARGRVVYSGAPDAYPGLHASAGAS